MQTQRFNRFVLSLASLGFIGHLPKMPGTWASLVTTLFAPIIFLPLPFIPRVVGLICVFVLGVYICNEAEKIFAHKDPKCVVWDEFFGQLLSMLCLACHAPWWHLAISFALFRFFDITKPWPVNILDSQCKGGMGIMLDDGAAGIYALIVTQVFLLF